MLQNRTGGILSGKGKKPQESKTYGCRSKKTEGADGAFIPEALRGIIDNDLGCTFINIYQNRGR